MNKGILLGLFAETPLHPGAGQATDVIDLPVAREGATGLPHIPDTGLKGAMRQWAEEVWSEGPKADASNEANGNKQKTEHLFGAADSGAGALMISSARLLCLPIRRLDGPYYWVTTPYLLERLRRDSRRCGCQLPVPNAQPGRSVCGLPELFAMQNADITIFLEEYAFKTVLCNKSADLKNAIKPLLGSDNATAERILSQLAIISDEEFDWFAANALPVNARNKLDERKISQNLWYEETIPPDALFYSVIIPRNEMARASCEEFLQALMENKYLQVGGNETVGQGWVQLASYPEVADAK